MKIIKREKILIDIEDVYCDDIGLFTLFKNHNLEFRHVSLTNKMPWKRFIYETLSLTFLYLLIKKYIEIQVVEFEKHHFFKLYKTRHRTFEIKSISPDSRSNDILSNILLKLIEEKPQNGCNSNYLHQIIFNLFDDYVGRREEYLKPEKEFFLKNLKLYVDKFDWLSIEEDFHNFGPMFKYTIHIEPIYIPRLKMQHGLVYDAHKTLSKSNHLYKLFNERLEVVLDYNYDMRNSLFSKSNRYVVLEFPIPNL